MIRQKFQLADACRSNIFRSFCNVNIIVVEVGEDYTVEELLHEILKDKNFYDSSNGGVTFSGGEPLMQHEFYHRR